MMKNTTNWVPQEVKTFGDPEMADEIEPKCPECEVAPVETYLDDMGYPQNQYCAKCAVYMDED